MVNKPSKKTPRTDSSPSASAPNKSDLKDLSLEGTLHELESLVHRLESGEDEIETAFNLYERAEEIANHAQKKLTTYENKLRVITQKGETFFQTVTQQEETEDEVEES